MNLNDILASSFSQIALSGHGASAYLIPNIPRKVLSKAWRTFCPQEARESILAVIDTSFFKNGKEGLVFTQNALYIKEPIHRVHQFVYRDIDAVIYFQTLSTYSGKSSVSMEIDTKNYDLELSDQLLRSLNTDVLNELLQKIVAMYRPDERKEIQEELTDSEKQIAHPERFKPHKFKDGDPQIYSK